MIQISALGAIALIASFSAAADDVLKTGPFTTCIDNSAIQVQRLNVSFDRNAKKVIYNVAGSSAAERKVEATLSAIVYGKQVFTKTFNPCDGPVKVSQLCPIPKGTFAATGEQEIPEQYASQIPSIAFNVPDLEGQAKLELHAIDGGKPLACIESNVANARTLDMPAVSYVAAGIAACSLVLSAFAAFAQGGTVGAHAPQPSFSTVFLWFQSVSLNGLLSVSYPPIYRHYTQNFAFAGGLVTWKGLQNQIDGFRRRTGGNLTNASAEYLGNISLIHSDASKAKRYLDIATQSFEPMLISRDTPDTNENTTNAASGTESNTKANHYVHGIQEYAEELSIPQSNVFLNVLAIFAIIVAAIVVGILLFKVILEAWALFASFPKRLTGFRKRYWGVMGRAITNLILLLYGIWTLYCIFQFTNGDSWAAKILAGVTLAIFTTLLAGFTFRIWQLVQRFKKIDGDTSALFEDKETWRNYSLFYDSYKRSYFWMFVPAIVYMFAKGCVIAGGNGHGLTQTAGQLIVESLMMVLLLLCRPFVSKSGNWINIFIQVVRVLSVACILVFVEEMGISQSTKTITGVVLIAVQSALTGLLAILIVANAIIVCVRQNPHRKQRKEAEKQNLDSDNLTNLSPRNTILMDASESKDKQTSIRVYSVGEKMDTSHRRPLSKALPACLKPGVSTASTISTNDGAPLRHSSIFHGRVTSRDIHRQSRQPTVPNLEFVQTGQAF